MKPRPERTLVWYLMVGHLTCGLKGPATGRGATRRALAWRAFRLSKAGWTNSKGPYKMVKRTFTIFKTHCILKCLLTTASLTLRVVALLLKLRILDICQVEFKAVDVTLLNRI